MHIRYNFCTFANEMRKIITILIVFGTLVPFRLMANSRIVGENIRTLRSRYMSNVSKDRTAQVLSRPYLVLRDGVADNTDEENMIEFSFDELSHELHLYSYTIHQLNADGSRSDMLSSEYLRGFSRCDITDYTYSTNTQQDYTHYSFHIPNEDMTITASGRYEVVVYEDGDENNVVLVTEFYVVSPEVQVRAKVSPNTSIELSGRYQQLDISVTDVQGQSRNMGDEYFIVVTQNGREDNQVYRPQPSIVSSNKLSWQNNKALIFEGGNEYRHFDTYSTYIAGYNVNRITYSEGEYHAILEPDGLRKGNYMHEYDNDGQFVVNAERVLYDSDTEGEYMWVHWVLNVDKPFLNPVYIVGDLFGNNLDAGTRMLYNADEKCYYFSAFLKQGGYNYIYALPTSGRRISLEETEGSYWQTQNEYRIYVYRRPFGSRSDELVGLYVII